VEKKLPEVLAALLSPDVVKGRHVRLMFQDEARFGRMVRIRRCWPDFRNWSGKTAIFSVRSDVSG
jgi:hypothetical protein